MASKLYLCFDRFEIKETELKEVDSVSGLSDVSDDILIAAVRSKYQAYVSWVENIKYDEGVVTYLYLKQGICHNANSDANLSVIFMLTRFVPDLCVEVR